MISLDKAEARAMVSVADAEFIARFRDSERSLVAREDLEDPIDQNPLILDGFRRRPRYFDGRFLTGADLTRDQDYVRQRQADMARAAGSCRGKAEPENGSADRRHRREVAHQVSNPSSRHQSDACRRRGRPRPGNCRHRYASWRFTATKLIEFIGD